MLVVCRLQCDLILQLRSQHGSNSCDANETSTRIRFRSLLFGRTVVQVKMLLVRVHSHMSVPLSGTPEGRPGMSDVSLLSGISGLSFDSTLLISSLVLLPSPVTLSVLSSSACWPFLLNLFQKILQYFSLRDGLFCLFLYGSC